MNQPSDQPSRIRALLLRSEEQSPSQIAIQAPGRKPLSYARLITHIDETIAALNRMGLGRSDRVSIVLPNGPEMAVAFLAVAGGMTCAPLNPAYRAQEFDFYLTDLCARAIIVQAGTDSPAVDVAKSRGIPIVDLSFQPGDEAGIFALSGATGLSPAPHALAEPDDTALILHTSGTTSRPKIVPLTQRNLCVSAESIRASIDLTASDRCLNVMPLFHIHGLLGALLSSLAAGGSVVCSPGFVATHFFDWVDQFAPTWYSAVPTMHQAILARSEANREIIARRPLRFIRSCSSSLPPQVMGELEQAFGVPVVEAYGMTEASHQMATNPLPPRKRKPGSVGLPAGPEIAIMGDAGSLLSVETPGEIVIKGANVTPGYENNPEANAGAFTNGWFRTGDQGYLDGDGYLFITGRIKEIINRGGEKISPREIDEVLMDHPAIAQAVTFAMPHPQLGEEVAAGVVLRPGQAATEQEIREFAAQTLADFKVPRRVVILDEIPKGPTGKLQRIGLAEKLGLVGGEPEGRAEDKPAFVAPRTALEEAIAGIWARLLRVEEVGVNDDFFEQGGDSVLAAQLVARVREAFKVELTILAFFEDATIAGVAEMIAANQAAPVEQAIRSQPDAEPTLSFSQARLWLLDQLEPGDVTYNRPTNLSLRGELNIPALERSLTEILRRHETLRARFMSVNGEPVQEFAAPEPIVLSVLDLSGLPEAERSSRVQEIALEDALRPFDLAKGPLLRASLIRLGPKEHILLQNIHHIAFDGWSQSVLLRELGALYEAFANGKPSPLPELPARYSDYARWQRDWLEGGALEAQLAYWREQLKELPTLELRPDRNRPAVLTAHGAHQSMVLPAELTESLKALAKLEGATLFMTLLAAYQTLLSRYTSQDDIVVGSPIAGRARTETEAMIGLFSNNLVLRTDLSGDPSFREAVQRVKRMAVEAFAHQDLPFEKLVNELHVDRDLSRLPLFQVAFNFHNYPTETAGVGELKIAPFVGETGIARFDLSLELAEKPEGLQCKFEYSTDLFDAETITRMQGHLLTLLQGIVADPGRSISALPILTEPERRQLVVEWNDTANPYPRDASIGEIFEAQVARTPDAVATVFESRQVTYGELNAQANQLAHHLRALGVRPEVTVGVCVERAPGMLIALLGVLKAGGICVPLDPEYPSARLGYMLEDTAPRVLVTQEKLTKSLPGHSARVVLLDADRDAIARQSDMDPSPIAVGGDLAYVVFTSGSTGRPKGAAIPHRAITRLVLNTNYVQFKPSDVVAQASSPSFDGALFEIWGAFLNGARLVWVDRETEISPKAFASQIHDQGISVMLVTTSIFNQVAAEAPGAFKPMRCLCFGGETSDPKWVREVLKQDPPEQLLHVYGPTECTTYAAWFRVLDVPEGATTVPIGRPLSNTRVYILDKRLEPAPIGVPGEIYIGGDCIARGYYNRPDITEERFVPDPFSKDPSARLYKTGDLARFLRDGNIEFLGRLDHQVKIRGFRIELEEIEAVLGEYPAVREAMVIAREDTPGDRRLVAYLIPERKEPNLIELLRAWAKQRLPDYMIPSAFVLLESFALTPNGKVDRQALPAPEGSRSELDKVAVAPRDRLELELAGIWEAILGVHPIGVTDDFFDLGGHSLLAVRLFALIEKHLGRKLPLATLFQASTVEQMARVMRQDGWNPPWSALVPIQPDGNRPPFYCVHCAGGEVLLYRDLAIHMGKDQPFYGLQELGWNGGEPGSATVAEMASRYTQELRRFQPEGPYLLGGYSSGGPIAFEMANQLREQGQEVALLAVIDSVAPVTLSRRENLRQHLERLSALRLKRKADYVATALWHSIISIPIHVLYRACKVLDRPFPMRLRRKRGKLFYRLVSMEYTPRPYPGQMVFVEGKDHRPNESRCTHTWWRDLAQGGIDLRYVPGDHAGMIREPHVRAVAECLRSCIDEAIARGG